MGVAQRLNRGERPSIAGQQTVPQGFPVRAQALEQLAAGLDDQATASLEASRECRVLGQEGLSLPGDAQAAEEVLEARLGAVASQGTDGALSVEFERDRGGHQARELNAERPGQRSRRLLRLKRRRADARQRRRAARELGLGGSDQGSNQTQATLGQVIGRRRVAVGPAVGREQATAHPLPPPGRSAIGRLLVGCRQDGWQIVGSKARRGEAPREDLLVGEVLPPPCEATVSPGLYLSSIARPFGQRAGTPPPEGLAHFPLTTLQGSCAPATRM